MTMSVCPSGCECQAVRAPGSNVTIAPVTRDGSSRANCPRIVARPVKNCSGPSTSSCMFLDMISVMVASCSSMRGTLVDSLAPSWGSCAAVDGEHACVPVVADLVDVLQRVHVVVGDLEIDVRVSPHVVGVRGLGERQEPEFQGVANRELRKRHAVLLRHASDVPVL